MHRAGLFLGYEHSTKVTYNSIYEVGQPNDVSGNDVVGIYLGGHRKDYSNANDVGTTGYNNFNITIEGNEVSKITSSKDVYGIKIEQEMNNFMYSQVVGDKYFTHHNDSLKLYNNVV